MRSWRRKTMKKPSKSSARMMNTTAANPRSVFWQYNFKWSRSHYFNESNSLLNIFRRNEMVAQEFWLFVASCLSLLFFLVIWAFVLVACKLIIKMVQDQQMYADDPECFSAPIQRNSAMMINCTVIPTSR